MMSQPFSKFDESPVRKTIVVASDVDRWGRKTVLSADQVWTKVSRKDTADGWCMFESRVPAGFGVGLHRHHQQEEWFWVLDGNFIFEVDGEIHRLETGMSLLAPRQLSHRWKKTRESDGRLLILVQPAGRLEDLFEQYAEMPLEERQDPVVLSRLFAEAEMEVLGPPFKDSFE